MTNFSYSDKTKELFGDPEAFMKTPDFDKMLNGDMVGYDSPITMFQKISDQIDFQIEQDCVSVVRSYGFNVNADELKRALEYDRGQYGKGYKNGYKDGYSKGIEDCLAKISTIVKGGDDNA